MKHRSEHQRNIAFDFIRMINGGANIADYFEMNEPIVIYGLDFLGKEFFNLVRVKTEVICFIDRSHDMENFQGIPVYSVDNPRLQEVLKKFKDIKVIVMIMHDWNNIQVDIVSKLKNARPVSIYDITSWIKLNKMNILENKQELALNVVGKMVADRDSCIDKIVLVGTTYTALLSMLILPKWEKTLYIAERFFPKKVVDKMTDYNIPCFYEDEAGEFYDICYVIAEYAKKRNIPIYGQDHMLLSQAFLENKITVIEDGDVNYKTERAKKYVRILDDNQVYYPFGYSELVKEIFLTDIMEIPKEIAYKVTVTDPAKLYNFKTEKEQNELNDIYAFPYSEIIDLVNKGKSILFLTEPYTKMKGQKSIAVDAQIDMYKKVLSVYDAEKIIIKPHPSDDIDYRRYMPEYSVISREFPIQILKWSGINLERIVMLGEHTCMYALRDIYEIDIHKEIVEQYGIRL